MISILTFAAFLAFATVMCREYVRVTRTPDDPNVGTG